MKIFNWMLVILVLIPIGAFAESQEEALEKLYSQDLAGWKGIVFICSFDANDNTLKRICNRGISDIELLAASNKVNLKIAKNNDFATATYMAAENGYVTLSYGLMATNPKGQNDVKAIHARLSFKEYYSNAVDNNAMQGSLDSMPRPGDLEFWSEQIIGSGNPSSIITPFSDEMEVFIKKALTLFIKYAK